MMMTSCKNRLRAFAAAVLLLAFTLVCTASAGGGHSVSMEDLCRQCAESLDKSDYGRVTVLARKLLAESVRHNDRRCEGYAYFYLGASELFSGKLRQVKNNLDKAADIGREMGNDTLLAYTYNNIAIYEISANLNAYTAQYYFIESLDYSKKASLGGLQMSIYGNLASISLIQGDTTGLRYARECYSQGKQHGDLRHVYIGAHHLAAIYHYMGKDAEALKYIREAFDIQKKTGNTDVSNLYRLYSAVLTNSGDYAKAETYALRSIEAAKKTLPPTLPDCYLQYARVLNKKREYRESNAELEKAIAAARKSNVYTAVVDIYELFADNYLALGNMSKALEYTRQAKDSAHAADMKDKQRLVNERQLVLDITKKEQEAELNRQRLDSQLKVSAALGAALVLLLVLLVVVFVNAENKNKLYKNIVRQHTKAMAREDELQRQIDELSAATSQDAKLHGVKLDEDKMDELYRRLCEMMEREKLYSDNQLNRERLAEMLGTNRTYLSHVISEKSGMNYSQFVNTYRVNEAIRVLSDSSKADYPLKQLCFDIGFSSLSTFYKIFKEQVGMTPSAYKKMYADMGGDLN